MEPTATSTSGEGNSVSTSDVSPVTEISPISESPVEIPVTPASSETPVAPTPIVDGNVYHTITGGPETLSELRARGAAPEGLTGEKPPSKEEVIPTSAFTSSGYSVPQREPLPTAPPVEHHSHIGFIFFLVVLLTVFGITLYIFMPEKIEPFLNAVTPVAKQMMEQVPAR